MQPVEVALSLIKDHRLMPTREKTLADLFLETLRDVYYAEKQAEQAGSAGKEGGENTKAEAAGKPAAKAKANKAKRVSAK